jgi:hypothetical protein
MRWYVHYNKEEEEEEIAMNVYLSLMIDWRSILLISSCLLVYPMRHFVLGY